MSIIRTEKSKNYSTICNECFRNDAISARAKGVFAYIMTLPDDWKLYKKELHTHFAEGRDAINKAFKELTDAGYISKTPVQTEGGLMDGWVFTVVETVGLKTRTTDSPACGKPATTNNLPVENTEDTKMSQPSTKDATPSDIINSGGTEKKKEGGGVSLKEFLDSGKRGYDPKKQRSFDNQNNYTDHELALNISKWFLKRTETAIGRRLTSKPSADPFIKLFKLGIDPDRIVKVCKWLNRDNLSSDYSFVVQSGDALYKKWDSICMAMDRNKGEAAPDSFVKDGKIYFPNEPKAAGGQMKYRVATDEEIRDSQKR